MKKVIIIILIIAGMLLVSFGIVFSANKFMESDNYTKKETELPPPSHEINKKLIKSANCTGEGKIDYSKFDKNDLNAANKAVACYQMKYDKLRGTKAAEDGYNDFWNFYVEFETQQNQQIYLSPIPLKDSYERQANKYSEKYYRYGLIVQFNEGEFVLSISRNYMYENFSKFLSEPTRELLKFYIQFDKRINYGTTYVIPKEKFYEYIEFYKNFGDKYPVYCRENKMDINKIINQYEEIIKNYPNVLY